MFGKPLQWALRVVCVPLCVFYVCMCSPPLSTKCVPGNFPKFLLCIILRIYFPVVNGDDAIHATWKALTTTSDSREYE